MPNKTPMSRFHIHDDLTAPEDSLPILKGLQASAGQLPNFLGVLAGSAAALRGYVRFRGELRRGTLPAGTRERIGLAVAGSLRSAPGIAQHERTARVAGIGVDEIAAIAADRDIPADDPPAPTGEGIPERRTVKIGGRPEGSLDASRYQRDRARRPPRTAHERIGARPDRIAMWAFALGLLLIVIALLTAL